MPNPKEVLEDLKVEQEVLNKRLLKEHMQTLVNFKSNWPKLKYDLENVVKAITFIEGLNGD